MNRRKFISASLGLGALAATARLGALAEPRLTPHTLTGRALGTTVSLLVLHENAAQARRALEDAMAEVQAVDALMSLYRSDSQVAILNRTGELREPDARVLEILRYCQDLSARTQGGFDITVQPLWDAYTEAQQRGTLPSPEVLRDRRWRVDWRQLDVSQQAVRLRGRGMAITLNGVAQGYASDRALAAVRRHGIEHALIDAGEFDALGGKENKAPWVLGIRHPRDANALAARLALDTRALATSGDYETFFTPDFRHNHIFDPATGDSPTELASASVLAPTATQADGLSTAFMVLGAARSLAMAAALPGVDALLIGKDGRRWRTPGLPELAA